MKKLIALLLSLMMVLAATAALADGLTFTTGGTAGTYYAYGNVLAQYVAGNSDVAVTAVAGNGSADNIDKLDMEVEHCFASDLMSDVLTLKDTPVLVTGLCNVQTIRTCDMANLDVVIFVRGKRPMEDMVELADENGMVLICTQYSMFKTCGILYQAGMKPLY